MVWDGRGEYGEVPQVPLIATTNTPNLKHHSKGLECRFHSRQVGQEVTGTTYRLSSSLRFLDPPSLISLEGSQRWPGPVKEL
ncbi:hypothetical protein RRF57_008965 [Xylaria bambusicola]|uniref:Uncharacterized protein n=1 Tax=Xylaria bambusicola TaxID=326684 RepID=A0AAN7UW61_9PEZI